MMLLKLLYSLEILNVLIICLLPILDLGIALLLGIDHSFNFIQKWELHQSTCLFVSLPKIRLLKLELNLLSCIDWLWIWFQILITSWFCLPCLHDLQRVLLWIFEVFLLSIYLSKELVESLLVIFTLEELSMRKSHVFLSHAISSVICTWVLP